MAERVTGDDADSSAGHQGRSQWSFEAIKYSLEYLILLAVALVVAGLFWAKFWSLPSRPEPDAWKKAPQRVWTPAEAAALSQQLVEGSLGVSAELYGPGPVPLDRSASRSLAGAQRQRFNQLTDRLKAEYQARLNGDANRGQSLQTLRENFVELLGQANPDQQGARDIAYQLAIVDFIKGDFEDSRKGLAAAGCNRALPANSTGEDANADARSWAIRCLWLEGRLALAPGQTDQPTREAGVIKLRSALDQAIAASEPDVARTTESNLGLGPGGRSRYSRIPSLLSGEYWMIMPEAAGASLWQDYLSALLATRTQLCSKACSTWDDWQRGAPTVDGKKFAELAQDNNSDIWRNYPELAALSRMLLTTNEMVLAAREIEPNQGGLNLQDADEGVDGFQLARGNSRQETVTMHRSYAEFARLAMIVSQSDPGDPAPGNRALSDASRVWLAHNESRGQWLSTGSADVGNPFDAGTPGDKAFSALQEQWSEQRQGDLAYGWLLLNVIATLLAIAVILFAAKATRALAPSRERHRAELFSSKYFTSAQNHQGQRGGSANA